MGSAGSWEPGECPSYPGLVWRPLHPLRWGSDKPHAQKDSGVFTGGAQPLGLLVSISLEYKTRESRSPSAGESKSKQRNPKHGFLGAGERPTTQAWGRGGGIAERKVTGFGLPWKRKLIEKGQRRCQGWHFFPLLLFLGWLSCWKEKESGKAGLRREAWGVKSTFKALRKRPLFKRTG